MLIISIITITLTIPSLWRRTHSAETWPHRAEAEYLSLLLLLSLLVVASLLLLSLLSLLVVLNFVIIDVISPTSRICLHGHLHGDVTISSPTAISLTKPSLFRTTLARGVNF